MATHEDAIFGEVPDWFGIGLDGHGEFAAYMTADELGLDVPKLMVNDDGEVVISHPSLRRTVRNPAGPHHDGCDFATQGDAS